MTEIDKKRVCYKIIPLKSLSQALKIVNLSRKNIKSVKCPTLIMQTENDEIANRESGEYILSNISSKQKELITVPESYHVFILDKYGKQTNKKILEFIKK